MWNVNFASIKETIGALINQSSGSDALQMLIEDHNRVKRNFQAFEHASDEEKKKLLAETLVELILHTKVEEQLVYPMLRQIDEDMFEEAKEEHHVADLLIAELEQQAGSNDVDAKFKVLGEIVKHHIQEEESEVFPKLRSKGDIDLNELGEEIAELKMRLMQQHKNIKSMTPKTGGGNGRSQGGKAAGKSRSSGRTSTRKAASAKGGRSSSKRSSASKSRSASAGKTAKKAASGSRKRTSSTSAKSNKTTRKSASRGKTSTTAKRSTAGKKGAASRSRKAG